MSQKRISHSKNISDDNLFLKFSKNFSKDIDKCYDYMYDSDIGKNVKTEINKEYFITTSEFFWSDIDINNKDISYKLNNKGHRSDNFCELSPKSFNVLFAGCSTTFGQGLPLELSWPSILYKDLSNTNKNIGPYNCLGFPGGSASKIIFNVIKYLNMFGSPDVIFILLPDFIRQEKYNRLPDRLTDIEGEDIEKFYVKVMSDYFDRKDNGIVDEEGFYDMYNLVITLEYICKKNNTKLYISSWDTLTNRRMLQLDLDNYVDINYDIGDSFYEDYAKTNSDIIDKKYLFDARDKMHPGHLVHLYTAKRFLQLFGGGRD